MFLKRTPKKLLREPQRKSQRSSKEPQRNCRNSKKDNPKESAAENPKENPKETPENPKEIPKKPKEIPENSRETKVGNGYYQKKQEMFRAADISCFFEICYFCLGGAVLLRITRVTGSSNVSPEMTRLSSLVSCAKRESR